MKVTKNVSSYANNDHGLQSGISELYFTYLPIFVGINGQS